MSIEKAKDLLLKAIAILQEATALLSPKEEPEPLPTTIKAGENLQPYLDKGGEYHIEARAAFSGTYIISKPVILHCNGASFHGVSGPAFIIHSGARGIYQDSFTVTSNARTVYQCGYNDDKQTALEGVPQDIVLSNLYIPYHRGPCGLEVNSFKTKVINPKIYDVWDPSLGTDSAAIKVLNSPGEFHLSGGELSAASENFLCGGDQTKIPNLIPQNIILEDFRAFKPLSWKSDGMKRNIKNLIEFKTGKNVIIRKFDISGSWKDAQDGYALMLTPTRGGELSNFTIEDGRIRDCAALLNMTGFDSWKLNPNRTKGMTLRRLNSFTEFAKHGSGTARCILIDSPEDFQVSDSTLIHDASSLVYQVGTPLENFEFMDSRAIAGKYSFNFKGYANSVEPGAKQFLVEGNTFASAPSALKSKFPNNRYLNAEEFKALFNEDWALK